MKARLAAAAAHLALAAFGTLLALLLAEIALRVLAPSGKGGKEQRERSRYTEHDPVLGWRKTPGAAVVYDRRDYHAEFRLNSRGLRGRERPYEKPPGVRRVLALGDSFVEAFMVGDAQTVTSRLEEELAARGCRAEVINGGTAAYSTDQEYLFYAQEGRRYAPDVVVVFVYHNDIPYLVLDDYLGVPKPRLDFSTQPPSLAREPVPSYPPPPPAPPPAAAPPGAPASYLLELVKDRLERTSAATYNRLARLGLWEPLRKLPMNDELRLFRVPELGHLRPAWSAFTWTLETLSKAVSASGARLVVAYVPSRMEVSANTWELTRARYDLDEGFDRSAVASRIRYIAGRLSLPMLDLTAPLAGEDSALRPVYYPTDSHWNARGQEVAAKALSGFLLGSGLAADCR